MFNRHLFKLICLKGDVDSMVTEVTILSIASGVLGLSAAIWGVLDPQVSVVAFTAAASFLVLAGLALAATRKR